MSLPAAEAMQHAPAAAAPAAAAMHISTINRRTGLSTDFLNHFTEAVMVLEMGTMMPDCLEDLRTWQPKTYCEHFAASRITDRDAVIAAYDAASPSVRDALNSASILLNAILADARDTLLAKLGTPEAEAVARCAAARAGPLITRAAGIINGSNADGDAPTQAAVDALFSR
jgi:hypothetical protein